MLNFILYPPGGNKNSELIKRISNTENAFLVVPEQCAFEYEALYLSALKAEKFHKIKILSFRTLCRYIFRNLGGLAGEYADETVKLITLRLALNQAADRLCVYKKSISHMGFMQKLLELFSELKNADITPTGFENALPKIANSLSAEKASELNLIYSIYHGLLAESFRDSLDDLAFAAEKVELGNIFENTNIFFDEFSSFSSAQKQLMRALLEDGANITVALAEGEKDDNRFFITKETKAELTELAALAGADVGQDFSVTETRFTTPLLAKLSKTAFTCSDQTLPENENVHAILCENEYEETKRLFCEITRLVRENGYRFKDIFVFCRDLELYLPIARGAGKSWNVPIFTDTRVPANNTPIMRAAKALVKLTADPSAANFISVLKSADTRFCLDDVCIFENYLFTWDLDGASLKNPFFAHPRGFCEEWTDADKKTLETAETIRESLFDIYKTLSKEKTTEKYCQSLTASLSILGVDSSSGDNKAPFELLQGIFEKIVRFENIIKDTELFDLLIFTIDTADFGIIPKTSDCVSFGTPGRSIPINPKAVFILGASETAFPAQGANTTLLGDSDRKALISAGLSLLPTDDKHLSGKEILSALTALSASTNRLYILARKGDISGNQIGVSKIFEHFQSVETTDKDALYTKDTAFSYFAEHYTENTDMIAALSLIFENDSRLSALEHFHKKKAFSLTDIALLQKEFPDKLSLSPSRIEAFARCPFSYFCKYSLALAPRTRAELDALANGSLIHDLIFAVTKDFDSFMTLSIEALSDKIHTETIRLINTRFGTVAANPARFMFLVDRAKSAVFRLCLGLKTQFEGSRFIPTKFEVSIPPITLEESGKKLSLVGKVDRVDTAEIDGVNYLRVIDYKSGGKEFSLSDVNAGLSIQMPLYLSALLKSAEFSDFFPSGVLYTPTGKGSTNFVNKGRELDDDKLKASLRNLYKQNGLMLDSPAMSGEIENVKLKSDHLFSISEFEKLDEFILEKIRKLSSRLFAGDIAPSPTAPEKSTASPCAYCDYKNICQNKAEPNSPTPISKEEMLS
jgi:ATP-dependent nuclease, subunit B